MHLGAHTVKSNTWSIDADATTDPYVVLSQCRRIKATPVTADDYQIQAPTRSDVLMTKAGGTPTEITPPQGLDWFRPGDIAMFGKSLGAGSIDFAIEEHIR